MGYFPQTLKTIAPALRQREPDSSTQRLFSGSRAFQQDQPYKDPEGHDQPQSTKSGGKTQLEWAGTFNPNSGLESAHFRQTHLTNLYVSKSSQSSVESPQPSASHATSAPPSIFLLDSKGGSPARGVVQNYFIK